MSDPPLCPACKGPVSFVRSTTAGGRLRWEVSVWVCPHDGPVYRTREGRPGPGGDDDSIVGSRLGPPSSPRQSAAAVPEPEDDRTSGDTAERLALLIGHMLRGNVGFTCGGFPLAPPCSPGSPPAGMA
jgi:hypothetical protein